MVEFELINPSGETPQNGYDYVQPESGKRFTHYSYDAFIKEISEHRLGNHYVMHADWEAELQDEQCKKHPSWFPYWCRRIQKLAPRKISFTASLSFLSMLVRWIAKGAKLVPQEEAEERASICATCPLNRPLQIGCGACMTKILQGINSLMGSKNTSLDDKLGACSICSCSLRASVHFPLEAQQFNLTDQMKEEFRKVEYCWKGKNL